jgi:hypothetical protein
MFGWVMLENMECLHFEVAFAAFFPQGLFPNTDIQERRCNIMDLRKAAS